MTVQVEDVADKVVSAIQASIESPASESMTRIKQAAEDLSVCLAVIEAKRATGNLTDDQAKALLGAAADNAKLSLMGIIGIDAGDVQGAIVAGLETLISVALSASGLGWAAPIVGSVVAAVTSPAPAT